MSMPMFVYLAGYLDVLAFPPNVINVDIKAGIFISVQKSDGFYSI